MSVKRSSAERGSERLAGRRRIRRRRAFVAFCILLLFLLTATIYELHQPFARIARVQIFGADQSLAAVALTAMQGSYLGIIPRDSTFFYSGSRIRADILAADPDIAAISLFRSGLTGLSIRIDNRVPIARWCSSTSSPQVAPSPTDCYVFDASGIIYATTSSVQLVNSFIVYESLASTTEIIGAVLPNAEKLPAAFDFARQLSTLAPPTGRQGSSVSSVVIRDGEVDDYLTSGTRITYVLGNEKNAYTALVSAGTNVNLADGSITYVDLRFDGKVYLKRK